MRLEKLVNYIQKHLYITFFILAFAIYLNILPNEFVLDDKIQIAGNPNIHSLSNIPKFFFGSTFADQSGELRGNYYKPLLTTSFAIMYSLFGNWPAPYHLIQIILHTINAIFVYKILLKFFNDRKSLFGSLFFLVHPINAETVIYIANLQDVLYFLFGISALYVYVYKAHSTRNSLITYILLGLSLLAKETGILFWGIFWIYQLVYTKTAKTSIVRSRMSGINRTQCDSAVQKTPTVRSGVFYTRKNVFTTTIILICMFCAYGVARVQVANIQSDSIKFSTIMRQPFERRLLHIPAMYSYYIQTFVMPYNLVVNQNWVISELNIVNFYAPAALLVMSLVAFILLLKANKQENTTQKTLIFFGAWFFIGLILHMQLYPLDATVATRWFYFPFVGLIGIIFVAYTQIIEKRKIHKNIVYGLTISIIVLFSIISFLRTFDWRTEGTLAAHDTKIDKHNFVLEVAYGLDYLNNKKYDEAENHFKRAIEIDPTNNMAWHNLGYMYETRGLEEDKKYYDKSEYYYKKALEVGHDAATYINMASLMLFKQQKPYKDVNEFLDKAIQAHPRVPKLLLMRALVLQKLGDTKTAEAYVIEAMKIVPNDPMYVQVYQWIQSGQDIKLEP